MAPAIFLPLSTFLLHSICTWFVQNTSQIFKFLRHALKESHLDEPHTLITLPIQHLHLALICIDFQSSTHLNKPSLHHPQVLLRLTTQNQVMCIQEARQFPFSSILQESHLSPSRPHLLLHHSIHIFIEKPRGHDAPLSHPTIYPKLITLTQVELST